jgi:hypothetical protein
MKTDANCIFCKIIAGQMPCFKLLEDHGTLAIMDIYPANDGIVSFCRRSIFPPSSILAMRHLPPSRIRLTVSRGP